MRSRLQRIVWLAALWCVAVPLAAEEPLLVIETSRSAQVLADFENSLWRDFSASKANGYFRKSKLFLKFDEASQVYQTLSTTLFGFDSLKRMARLRAVLELYNVRELLFVAALEMEEKDFQLTRFYLDRARFKTFSSDGLSYFLRSDAEGKKFFCFYFKDRLLVLANAPRLIEATLGKLKKGEKIFPSQRESLAEKDFDLFMRFHPTILQSPYFQSYWFNGEVLRLKQNVQRADVYVRSGNDEVSEVRYLYFAQPPEKILALGGESIPSGDVVQLTSIPGEVRMILNSYAGLTPGLPLPDKVLLVRSLTLDERLLADNRHWLKLEFSASDLAEKWRAHLQEKLASSSKYLAPLFFSVRGKDLFVQSREQEEYHEKPLGADIVSYGFLRLERLIPNALREIKAFAAFQRLGEDEADVLKEFVDPLLRSLQRIRTVEKYTHAAGPYFKETVIYSLSPGR